MYPHGYERTSMGDRFMKSKKAFKRWFLLAACSLYSLLLMTQNFSADSVLTVNEKVAQIIDEVITAGMSEKDKALALHDWLTDHAHYDLTFSHYEADGVLLYGTGVCDSYSKAYQLLLNQAGIENFRITGEAIDSSGVREAHAWNAVKIDGKWSHVDVTWDDPINPDNPNSNLPKSGDEQHVYFMVSNRVMKEDHFPDDESAVLVNGSFTDEEEVLPAPVSMNARVGAPDFSLVTTAGKTLTKSGYGTGKKLMMIYGRTTCGNTLAFLNVIKPYIGKLKENGVTVLLALFDDPDFAEMKQMESSYPGIVCTKLTANDVSMWNGLSAFKYSSNSVVFPVVFLKNAQDAFVYYSVGYIEDPLRVVSGALVIPAGAAPSSGNTNTSTSGGSQTQGTTTGTNSSTNTSTNSSTDPTQATPSKTNAADAGTSAARSANAKSTSSAVVKTVTFGNGKYKLNLTKKTASLIAPKSKNIVGLVIPAVVKANHTSYKVNEISKKACKDLKKLTSVAIGKNVLSIGANAFNGCSKLKKVTGGACVGVIGSSAFAECVSLKIIPGFARLQNIRANAFRNCKLLSKITIGSKVKRIGKYAFIKCAKLKTINIKTRSLKASTIGTGAFSDIYKKAVIKVPKASLKAYKKLLVKKGAPKTCIIK